MLINFTGRLEKKDGTVVAPTIRGVIDFTAASRMRLGAWSGSADLDPSIAFSLFNLSDPIRLVTDGGEHGDLFVTNIDQGGAPTAHVRFQGTGPFGRG